MIDARVDDAIRQHRQKMDWLLGDEVHNPTSAQHGVLLGGKGENLGFSVLPQAQEVLSPLEGDLDCTTTLQEGNTGHRGAPPNEGRPV